MLLKMTSNLSNINFMLGMAQMQDSLYLSIRY